LKIDLSTHQRRRLLDVWRSAGWPFLDTTEAELLAGGWLERRWDAEQRVTVHLTVKGMRAIVDAARTNRQRLSSHEALVERVARLMHDEGQVVWRGLPFATWMTLARAAPIRFEPQTQSLRVEGSACDQEINPLCESSIRSSMRSVNAD
jgi:hypothetical protein